MTIIKSSYIYTYLCVIILTFILPFHNINAKVATGFWYGDSRPPKVKLIITNI